LNPPVFADTTYWIALISRQDHLHGRAQEMAQQFSDTLIVTSDMVLAEVLNALSRPTHIRRCASEIVSEICADEKVCVVPQTRELFDRAHLFYQQRMDKEWGLTDCASFVIMGDRSLTKALTSDTHFEQNGCQALLRDR
jgi:uncharacterized protein